MGFVHFGCMCVRRCDACRALCDCGEVETRFELSKQPQKFQRFALKAFLFVCNSVFAEVLPQVQRVYADHIQAACEHVYEWLCMCVCGCGCGLATQLKCQLLFRAAICMQFEKWCKRKAQGSKVNATLHMRAHNMVVAYTHTYICMYSYLPNKHTHTHTTGRQIH